MVTMSTPHRLIGNPLVGDWEENGEELLAFSLGHYLAAALPVQDTNVIDYVALKERFVDLASRNDEWGQYFCSVFDAEEMVKAGLPSAGGMMRLRKVLAEYAIHPFALVSLDIAFLLRTVRCIEEFPEYSPEIHIFPILLSLLHFKDLGGSLLKKELSIVSEKLLKMHQEGSRDFQNKIEQVIMSILVNLPSQYPLRNALVQRTNFTRELLFLNRLFVKQLFFVLNANIQPFEKSYLVFQRRHPLKAYTFCADGLRVEPTSISFNIHLPKDCYFLNAVVQDGNLEWLTTKFCKSSYFPTNQFLNHVEPRSTARKERRLIIISLVQPPDCVTQELISNLQAGSINEGLESMPNWKYLSMAYGITVFESIAAIEHY